MTIGQKLTALRKGRGMTQEELSEAIGVTRQTISKWELDVSAPDLDYLCKLCDLFGVTADYLIRPEQEAPVPPDPPPTENREPPAASPLLRARIAGWVVLGLTGIVLLAALLLRSNGLLILTGITTILALELLLLRCPVQGMLWTVWGTFTLLFILVTGPPRALICGIQAVLGDIGTSLATILSDVWLVYTAFCIVVTVRMFLRRKRRKAAK
jgi:transcriptional regulator with XRE-family HTH domain